MVGLPSSGEDSCLHCVSATPQPRALSGGHQGSQAGLPPADVTFAWGSQLSADLCPLWFVILWVDIAFSPCGWQHPGI